MVKELAGRRVLLLAVALVAIASAAVWWGRRPAPETTVAPGASRGGRLVATIRTEPRSFNRFVARDRTSNLLSLLLHGKLARIDGATQALEPDLAERWTAAGDGRTWTVRLRPGLAFSDGAPLTSADVLFSFAAAYDERTASALGGSLLVGGQPLAVTAPDPQTVVITFPAPFGPGLRLLDNLPILPRHKLGTALEEGRLREMWGLTTPPGELAGAGPFVLADYRPGERLVLARNPRYWRRDDRGAALPRLDTLTLLIVPDQNAELLRLESGETDLISGDVRPEDLAAIRRAADQGRVQLLDVGTALDADYFWFNLTPGAVPADRTWLQRRELREAVSLAVDRRALADTVYLGAAVPVAGPVTPGNHDWYDPSLAVPAPDPGRARQLLAAAGLTDRDGDGRLEAPDGSPARFTLLTQKGNSLRERAAAFLQQDLSKVGLAADVVTLEAPALIERLTARQYEAAFFVVQASDTDPASNLDFWLSGGAFHLWNAEQAAPATPWEARIDALMHQQVAVTDPVERRRLFNEVQRIFAQELPAIAFVAPKVSIAIGARVTGVRPSVLQPFVLWDAATLGVR
jgi:peptide/nickel transport system substrate-binding protein